MFTVNNSRKLVGLIDCPQVSIKSVEYKEQGLVHTEEDAFLTNRGESPTATLRAKLRCAIEKDVFKSDLCPALGNRYSRTSIIDKIGER